MYKGERLNSATHLLGLILAGFAVQTMMQRAVTLERDGITVISCAVFALGMVAVYASSTLYHCSRGSRKHIWEKADHCAIFLLIAGTYTPLGLIPLRNDWGWTLVAAVWLLAAIGVLRELRSATSAVPALPLYLAMGWTGVIAALPIFRNVSGPALFWLLGGMACYTLGVLFYVNDKRWLHAHGIWHIFVVGGSGAHVMMVWHLLGLDSGS